MTVEHTCITTYLSGQSPCSLQSLKYNIAGAINESSVVVDPPMRSSMALKLGIATATMHEHAVKIVRVTQRRQVNTANKMLCSFYDRQ